MLASTVRTVGGRRRPTATECRGLRCCTRSSSQDASPCSRGHPSDPPVRLADRAPHGPKHRVRQVWYEGAVVAVVVAVDRPQCSTAAPWTHLFLVHGSLPPHRQAFCGRCCHRTPLCWSERRASASFTATISGSNWRGCPFSSTSRITSSMRAPEGGVLVALKRAGMLLSGAQTFEVCCSEARKPLDEGPPRWPALTTTATNPAPTSSSKCRGTLPNDTPASAANRRWVVAHSSSPPRRDAQRHVQLHCRAGQAPECLPLRSVDPSEPVVRGIQLSSPSPRKAPVPLRAPVSRRHPVEEAGPDRPAALRPRLGSSVGARAVLGQQGPFEFCGPFLRQSRPRGAARLRDPAAPPHATDWHRRVLPSVPGRRPPCPPWGSPRRSARRSATSRTPSPPSSVIAMPGFGGTPATSTLHAGIGPNRDCHEYE